MKIDLYEVDLKTRERKMRKSALTLKRIVERKSLNFIF
jgi:hypothetical protein